MNQSDLFDTPEITQKVERPIVSNKTRQTKKEIPSEYIPITFDSLGKLLAPSKLHFKNYTMENMLQLAATKKEKQLHVLVSVLNTMVYEDFDCRYLHDKELQTVLMTLYLQYWKKIVENIPYIKDPDKDPTEDNIGRVDVDLEDIKTNVIKPEFKEPIGIIVDNKKVYFQLDKLDTELTAIDYIEEKYRVQNREFSDLVALMEKRKKVLEENKQIEKINAENEKKNALIKSDIKIPLQPIKEVPEIPEDELESYQEFVKEKSLDYIRVSQACLIHEKSATTIEEKIELVINLDVEYWRRYELIKKEYSDFGPANEIEMLDPDTQKKVSRRLEFRYTDFIPTVESSNNSRSEVTFG